jgi:hypothetical protein
MTSPINKIPNSKFQILNSQDGVTLLLALLVLSSVLAISFSLATVIFVEVRSSGDLLRTETSYYGAHSISEQALYKITRKINQGGNSGQCDASLPNCYSTIVGKVTTSGNSPVESAIADPVQQDTISQGATWPANGFPTLAKHYVLYNPNNPTGGSGYRRLKLTYLSSGNSDHLFVYVCQFHPNYSVGDQYSTVPCSNSSYSQGYWLTPSGGYEMYPPNRGTYELDLDDTQQQELILFNQGTQGPIYVQIETLDSSLNPKGIPYFQQQAVDISTSLGGVSRKLRVIIPNYTGSTATSSN